MVKKVEFSKNFRRGDFQTNIFKDFNHLSKPQKELLFDFIDSFTSKIPQPLCGSNKKNKYQASKLFNYHIGYKNYNSLKPICDEHSLCFNLTEDYYGKESSGVIHYVKFTDSHIGIISFGETHNPFPQEDDKKNILIERAVGSFVDI